MAMQTGGKQPINSMARMLKDFIGKRNSVLFVVLDEVHVPLKHDNSRADHLIYCLARINEALKGSPVSVSLCLVSSRDVLSMLEGSTRGVFNRHNIVNLEKYDGRALKDILVHRVRLAFHPGTASGDCLDLIADIAAGSGDARYALEMLYMAGMAAECEGSEMVLPEHIRAAKAEMQPHVTNKMLEELGDHEYLLLLGIARVLRKSEYIGFDGALMAYRIECESRDSNPRKKTQVRALLDGLHMLGLVSIRREGKGKTSRVQISIEDVPVERLIESLERGFRP
jgi:cell division control protein 6